MNNPLLLRWSAFFLVGAFAFRLGAVGVDPRRDTDFNTGWRFLRADVPGAENTDFDDTAWETVSLPHTARIEPLVMTDGQWQGICWYRKAVPLPAETKDKTVVLRFEGAMNTADVWVNGSPAGTFQGGYLPYVIDISKLIKPGATNVIAVRLDNRDNAITGPKPLKDLDFNLYSGLYRPAHLVLKDPLHITDPLLANKPGSGGVFVTFPEVSEESAIVKVETHVRNAGDADRTVFLRATLLDAQGQVVAQAHTGRRSLSPGSDHQWSQELHVPKPKLWSPGSPYLYTVRTELVGPEAVVDSESTRVGIRRIEITPDGFRVNGQKIFLRGANRHQEYPYIGNALSDDAQYRDALKIKQAGFDYVRLSHYPQSPAFLDACDELGLAVMDCLMGWQFFNPDPAFAELKYQECRQLIRRDRNHACVILWEVSLNESAMPREFVRRMQTIAHEEYPGDQCYTSGWTDGYDVFIQARQAGGCRGVTHRPCVVSEYGDWEYYAQNAGLHQELWKDLQPAERNSRQLRGDGQVRLLQQALNFQEAHNDNLKTRAFADGVWVMFDYNRGYADDIEASGVMDIFRLPKFGYWFFRSQRDPQERVAGEPVGPMVFIANDWTPDSPTEVRVFSNCEEVELHLNGRLVERRSPDTNRVSMHLKHAPFTFALDRFEPGTLQAFGLIDGKRVAEHERRTPGAPAQLALRFDLGDQPFAARGKDSILCYVDLLDASGTRVPDAQFAVFGGVTGDAHLVGQYPILSEAGTATFLLESDRANPLCQVYALCLVPTPEGVRVLSTSGSPDNRHTPSFEIRYTTDGSIPTPDSDLFRGPVANVPGLRAGLFVKGRLVAKGDVRQAAVSTGRFPAPGLAASSR